MNKPINHTSLIELQQWMQSLVTNKFPPSEKEQIEKFILPSQRLSAQRHLQIYRQSYIARLRECMKKQFAALAYTLGEELFQQFADEYLDAHPSTNYSLNTLGAKFPEFLEQSRPDKTLNEKEVWIDFMIELSRFEYAFSELFEEIESGDKRQIVKVFKHSFPIGRYYLEYSHGKEPEMYIPEETYCLIKRENYKLSILETNKSVYDKYSMYGE